MDNVDLAILRDVVAWRDAGHGVVLGTVTLTWGSAPRPVGSVVALRDDGRVAGSVSGGCIEDDLNARLKREWPARPQALRYGVSADEATRFGLPCGGTLELLLEPVHEHSRLPELLQRVARGERVRRCLSIEDGRVDLAPAAADDTLALTAGSLVTVHGPQWRLLLIGAGQLAYYLAPMAQALSYEVLVCDPRAEYADGWAVPGATLLRTMPDDAVVSLRPDAHTAVVALTHDPKLDDLALIEALASEAFYVGAIGSRTNQARRRERLAEHFGLSDAQLDRLHGPVGLKNGARTPPEIAVAILAELTAQRYGYRIPAPQRVSPAEQGATASSRIIG